MASLLIRKGRVVTETAESPADLLITGEKIAAIGEPGALTAPADAAVIDAEGLLVLPGGIDVHTHMNLNTGQTVASDDFYTGTVAAACGGTTCIVDHVSFGPPGCKLRHQIDAYHALAQGKAVIDYGFHGVIQHVDDEVLDSMKSLADEGITSVKLYMTYGFKIDDAGFFRVLRRAKELGVTVCVHAENDGVIALLREEAGAAGHVSPKWHPRTRPPDTEAEAVSRAIHLARLAGDAPLYIVHLTNAQALAHIRAARAKGQRHLYAETCPQYLLLDDSAYDADPRTALGYIKCPPLRTPADNDVLWEALTRDIDVVATDHCPFMLKIQKLHFASGGTGNIGDIDFRLCPSGAPGVEERLSLLYSEGVNRGRITLRRFVELCSTNPAKRFGLYPRKGVLAAGSDADVLLWDPKAPGVLHAASLHSTVDYTPYEGLRLTGAPHTVISRGEVIVSKGKFCGEAGRGRFVARPWRD
jgi:dihydropyrimidinase